MLRDFQGMCSACLTVGPRRLEAASSLSISRNGFLKSTNRQSPKQKMEAQGQRIMSLIQLKGFISVLIQLLGVP